MRTASERTVNAVMDRVATVIQTINGHEARNYITNAGYAFARVKAALAQVPIVSVGVALCELELVAWEVVCELKVS